MKKYYEILTNEETIKIFGGEDAENEKYYEFILIDGELIRITGK